MARFGASRLPPHWCRIRPRLPAWRSGVDPAGDRSRDDFGRPGRSIYRRQTRGTSPAAAMRGDMRKLIVSSLVSLDGIHGNPQSWIGDYFDQQAAEESLAMLL